MIRRKKPRAETEKLVPSRTEIIVDSVFSAAGDVGTAR
jgi:hypothetical protein